ncbi:MAG: hypothetical protein E7312_01090 [Clostridiales bacterium]|nr:hypothetical protein [Clostridiales bacterium]
MKYVIKQNNIPSPFTVHGMRVDFSRFPLEIGQKVSPNVAGLSQLSTGGRIRFMTNSKSITYTVEILDTNLNCASDVLSDGIYCGKIEPKNYDTDKIMSGTLSLCPDGIESEDKMKLITIFVPRTARLVKIEIELDDGAKLEKAPDYAIKKPIVYYGSSITQGACTTTPSKAYTALVSERLGADHINMGFGGSAMGEEAMAEYIASLDMSCFVLDYDYNAPSIDHLKATHKRFFDIIREKNPTLPIMIMSGICPGGGSIGMYQRRRVIMDTFHQALDNGDNYVDFINGDYLLGNYDLETCVLEGDVHPNEKGFGRMADVVAPRLAELLKRTGTVEVKDVKLIADAL